jgi:hypothetical protein
MVRAGPLWRLSFKDSRDVGPHRVSSMQVQAVIIPSFSAANPIDQNIDWKRL